MALDPPTYDTISPPLCSRSVILLKGNGHRPDRSHFLRPPKLVLEGVLYGTFSPPQNRTIRFAPPFANSQSKPSGRNCPVPPFCIFWGIHCFFSPCKEVLVVLSAFHFFSKISRGSAGIKSCIWAKTGRFGNFSCCAC